MKLSARNQLPCTVKAVRRGPIHSEITMVIDNTHYEVTAVITTTSMKRLGLKNGARAIALIKSSAIILGVQ